MLIKWMETSRFSSSKESALYIMCCEGDVLCGIWHWWGNNAPHCTSKADGKRCLLLQPQAAPPSSSDLGENDDTWWYRTPNSSWQCKESHRCCFHRSLYSPDMSPCDYDLFTKVKEQLLGTKYNIKDELICAIKYGTSSKMDALTVYTIF